MFNHFELGRRIWYPGLFVGLMGLGALFLAYLGMTHRVAFELGLELATAITGTVGGFVFFLYTQHHQTTQLFVSLFDKFNERYDCLNEKLNAIVACGEGSELQPNDKNALYDYFNLCAEEYLYFKTGYIDRDVWVAWLCGMNYFAKHPPIRRFWEKELNLQLGAYYGFSLDLLKDCPNRA